MKIKCFKATCPQCKTTGSIQLFINKNLDLRYARTRHYTHLDKDSKKPQFTYCKIQNLEALKTLLLNKSISLHTGKTVSGQGNIDPYVDHKLKDPSSNSKNGWAGSSVRTEHHPPKNPEHIDPDKLGIDPAEYRTFLLSKYSRSYALQLFNNAIKHHECLENPQALFSIPTSTRGNVLKAMANLAKYTGTYEEYKTKLKNYGVKWVNTDSSFNSFLSIINNNHSTLGQWYTKALEVLPESEKLFLKFTLLSGLRKSEAINSFNLIINLARNDKLHEYYNEELSILEHFKHADYFLRTTKNCYITILSKELVYEVARSKPVNYYVLRKHLWKHKLPLRIKELRSYYASYLRKHGLISEIVDLLQGRVAKSVFVRHYLKIEDFKALKTQVLAIIENLERELLS